MSCPFKLCPCLLQPWAQPKKNNLLPWFKHIMFSVNLCVHLLIHHLKKETFIRLFSQATEFRLENSLHFFYMARGGIKKIIIPPSSFSMDSSIRNRTKDLNILLYNRQSGQWGHEVGVIITEVALAVLHDSSGYKLFFWGGPTFFGGFWSIHVTFTVGLN